MKTKFGVVVLAGLLTAGGGTAVAQEESLRISTDDKNSISTFSADVNPDAPKPKDPVAAARSAYYFMDYTVARRAWEPMAEAGVADAQFGLFQIYSLGQHVIPDLDRAMTWLRKAAAQGHAGAQFNFGLAYLRGEGAPHDNLQAWLWFSRAERQNYPSAERARAAAERRLSAAELAAARKQLPAP